MLWLFMSAVRLETLKKKNEMKQRSTFDLPVSPDWVVREYLLEAPEIVIVCLE